MPALSRSEEKLLVGLRRRRVRESEGLFLGEGVRIAEEALRAGIVLELAVATASLEDTPRGAELVARLKEHSAFRRVDTGTLARIAATESPQGVVLAGRMPDPDVESRLGPATRVLVLDGVQDPGNFGTLVRSADAFAAAAVIALPGTVDPWNPKAVRAAAGSSFRVPVLQLTTEAAVEWLRDRGFVILAADAGGVPLESRAWSGRVGVVVGNEGAGIGSALRTAADAVVSIPTPGPAESLNVAVAAGILLHELSKGDRT